jgi:hypothetical protein
LLEEPMGDDYANLTYESLVPDNVVEADADFLYLR